MGVYVCNNPLVQNNINNNVKVPYIKHLFEAVLLRKMFIAFFFILHFCQQES